ncbi:DUF1573 domain-containing protein [bacterium]|nr:DUF1573 domain-containing protein [bacterium]
MKLLPLLVITTWMFTGPKIHFDEKKFNFGDKAFRSKVEHTFSFENTGDAPLIIESHETSCHCTSALYSDAPVMPGEKGEVVVKYDATKVGFFYRKVTLHTNAGDETLIIKGEITEKKEKVDPITGH